MQKGRFLPVLAADCKSPQALSGFSTFEPAESMIPAHYKACFCMTKAVNFFLALKPSF